MKLVLTSIFGTKMAEANLRSDETVVDVTALLKKARWGDNGVVRKDLEHLLSVIKLGDTIMVVP